MYELTFLDSEQGNFKTFGLIYIYMLDIRKFELFGPGC